MTNKGVWRGGGGIREKALFLLRLAVSVSVSLNVCVYWVFVCLFLLIQSLCSLGWSGTCYLDQAGFFYLTNAGTKRAPYYTQLWAYIFSNRVWCRTGFHLNRPRHDTFSPLGCFKGLQGLD